MYEVRTGAVVSTGQTETRGSEYLTRRTQAVCAVHHVVFPWMSLLPCIPARKLPIGAARCSGRPSGRGLLTVLLRRRHGDGFDDGGKIKDSSKVKKLKCY
jgi:hypothetical protein